MKNKTNKQLVLELNNMLSVLKPLFVKENFDLAKEKGFKGKIEDLADIYRPDYPVMSGTILDSNDFATLRTVQCFLKQHEDMTPEEFNEMLAESKSLFAKSLVGGREKISSQNDGKVQFNKKDFEFINKMQLGIKDFCDMVRKSNETNMAICVGNHIAQTEKYNEIYNKNSLLVM